MSTPYDSPLPPLQPPPPSNTHEHAVDFLRNHVEGSTGAGSHPIPVEPAIMDLDTPPHQQQQESAEEEQKRVDAFNKRFRRPQTTDPRDFHYVSDARWTQLRRDLEHCERTGKSPKTTLNNIAKVVDAGAMAETDEGCPAETACSECNKRTNVVCYAWRDPSKGRSCAYCKKQGISRCDAKQAEMRSEMERKVDAIVETVDVVLAQLRVLSNEILGRDATTVTRLQGVPKLPSSVAAMRARIERGGRESSDEDEESESSSRNHDPALTNGYHQDSLERRVAALNGDGPGHQNGSDGGYPSLPNGIRGGPDERDAGLEGPAMEAGDRNVPPHQQHQQQGRKRSRPSGATDTSTSSRRRTKNSRLDWETINGADIISGIRAAANEEGAVGGDTAAAAPPPPATALNESAPRPSSHSPQPSPDAVDAAAAASAAAAAGLSGLSQLASSAVAGFRPL